MLRRTIDVDAGLTLVRTVPLSQQHLFALFVPTGPVHFLLHVNPAASLLLNGVGMMAASFLRLRFWACDRLGLGYVIDTQH